MSGQDSLGIGDVLQEASRNPEAVRQEQRVSHDRRWVLKTAPERLRIRLFEFLCSFCSHAVQAHSYIPAVATLSPAAPYPPSSGPLPEPAELPVPPLLQPKGKTGKGNERGLGAVTCGGWCPGSREAAQRPG